MTPTEYTRSTGLTDYMFSERYSLLARATSLYHVGLPLFLLWLVWRLGYDHRGPYLQSLIGALAVIGASLFTQPERNVNWVYRPLGIEQTWKPEPLWVLVLVVVYPLVLYVPGHYLIQFLLRFKPSRGTHDRR